ncbi:MAG TPA: RluA family pseudouridine synthase [Acidimicrobiia bacterium]|nr:RluA family pseudouridine synthase [Acidimicrobiia bacterium]
MAEQVELEVPAALDGARVDRAVAQLLEVSRARAVLLWDERVTVGGKEVRPSDRVSTGDVITCPRPEDMTSLVAEDVPFGVLYEDDDVVVVDKPAGMVVHPGSGRSTGTLAAGLIHRYPEVEGVGSNDRWGLVHRLDKDTSGTILVARTQGAFEKLVADLRRRNIGRVYLALVEGSMGSPTGTIEAPIGRDPTRPTRRAVTHTGKHARTHYEVVRYFEMSDATLIEVTLDTGRTHQIRVHLSAIGHPVAGDRTYGATRRDLNSPRTFLHASRLEFDHPRTGDRISVKAPLPADLAGVLDRLS